VLRTIVFPANDVKAEIVEKIVDLTDEEDQIWVE
jgi:hypothetical protein